MDLNLVVVDGSVTAHNAARIAVQIAKWEHQRILGLYIIDETLVLDAYASYQKELGWKRRPDSRAELTKWFEEVGNVALDQLKQLCDQANIQVETQILFGGVPELILDRSTEAQMLTLGRRGRGHASDLDHLGSNFRHIAHHADIPLLVGGGVSGPLERIVLLYDGSPRFDLALDWTVRLQQSLSADVILVAMDQVAPTTLSQDIHERIIQHGLTNYHYQPLYKESISGVLETMTESRADLILVGGYRHPEILEWLVGGRIDQTLRQSQLPVLIA